MVRVEYVREKVIVHVGNSWDSVGSSAVYRPSRIARRTDAPRRLSAALVKPHRAAAWRGRRPCRRASTSRRSCRGGATVSGRAATARTCRHHRGRARRQRCFVTVTPSILMEVTRRTSGICGVGSSAVSAPALAVCEYDFSRRGPVKSQIIVLRLPVYMI